MKIHQELVQTKSKVYGICLFVFSAAGFPTENKMSQKNQKRVMDCMHGVVVWCKPILVFSLPQAEQYRNTDFNYCPSMVLIVNLLLNSNQAIYSWFPDD